MSTVTIPEPQIHHSGIYQCIVTNHLGLQDYRAWLLEVREESKLYRTKQYALMYLSLFLVQVFPSQYSYNFSTINIQTSNAIFSSEELTTLVCTDPPSSVLFDGNSPTFPGLVGNMTWISQLLTIHSNSVTVVFNFNDYTFVRKIEVVLVNCEQLGATIESIAVTDGSSVQVFPVASMISCNLPVTVCMPNLNINSTVIIFDFNTLNLLDSVYLLEVRFYEEGHTCLPIIIRTFTPEEDCFDGEPPSFLINGEPPAYVAVNTEEAGNNLVLPCQVVGMPAPSVSWFKEGSEIDDQFVMPDGTLTLRVTENEIPRQGIIYYCIATNRIGRGSSTIASLRSRNVNVTLSCT